MFKFIRTLPVVQSWKLRGFEKPVFIGLKQVFFREVFLEKAKNRYFFVGVILEFERFLGPEHRSVEYEKAGIAISNNSGLRGG